MEIKDEEGGGNAEAWGCEVRCPVPQRGVEAAAAGAAGVAALPVELVLLSRAGVRVSGSVARCEAAGPVGKYSGPRWPQPTAAAALAARTSVLTRIWGAFNIRKL